jgi:hypothetical protein
MAEPHGGAAQTIFTGMSRQARYFPKDSAPSTDGDGMFTGVNMKLAADLLPQGICQAATNKRFRNGKAVTREGMITPVGFRFTHSLPGFVLFLCLDQTGSIGIGGAQRGIEIIDQFRNEVGDQQIRGIGFVSFGDILCETYEITDDLDAVRARLQEVVDSGGTDPVFFQDGGGDTPENGVDALQRAIDRIANSSLAQRADHRYIYLKTDTAGYAHQSADPNTVLATLNSSAISRTWLEFNPENTDSGDEGLYATQFAASTKILHGDFDPLSDPPTANVTVNAVYGSGIFSDPSGVEWLLVATDAVVFQFRDGHTPRTITIPGVLTGRVSLVQAFNTVLMFRGADKTPWQWDGTRTAGFVAVDQTDHLDATTPIPNGSDRTGLVPVLMNNRLLVPAGRDRIAVSDIFDYTRYDATFNDFNVNSGSDDVLTALYPFTRTSLLVFKDQSIFLIDGISGDLSGTRLDTINREIGCVAGGSVAMVGADVFFLSSSGVYRVLQVVQDRIQTAAVPVSDPIQPMMRRINWKAAGGATAAVHGDYYYLAVPLDGSTRNNAVLPYNTVTDSWEGVHTWPAGVAFDALHVTDWGGVKRLWAVDYTNRRTHLLYEGWTDLTGDTETQITDELVSRAYTLGDPGVKRFRHLSLATETWNSAFTATLKLPGIAEAQELATVTKSAAAMTAFGMEPYVASNVNDDHARAHREDYSIDLAQAIHFGSGLDFNLQQETLHRMNARAAGRYAAVRITSTRGHTGIAGITLEAEPVEHARTR